MGLIASIFGYLCAVTVLVVTLLMSFDAFLYPTAQTSIGRQTIATAAKAPVSQPTSMPTARNAQPASPVATEAAADDPSGRLADAVSREPRARRLVRQTRAKGWAFQQQSNASRYAEDPSANFLYDRFQ